MNIKEMHYDFKQKLNKVDSQQYRNLKVPEIDWKLNEAIVLFVKIVAEPKHATKLGFETSQRTIDDIRTLVVNDENLTLLFTETESVSFELPDNYFDYIGTQKLMIEKNGCEASAINVILRQHDDNFEASPFDRSSFLWREVNIRFNEDGIKVFTSGEFEVPSLSINYIKQPASVNNSESFVGGQYVTLAGVTLDTNVDCDLPWQVHNEIVDLAVAITTGDLQIPDYAIKKDKLNYNQLS